MKADHIFTCWASMPDGSARRLEVAAIEAIEARRLAFAAEPTALSMSCRILTVRIEQERRHGI